MRDSIVADRAERFMIVLSKVKQKLIQILDMQNLFPLRKVKQRLSSSKRTLLKQSNFDLQQHRKTKLVRGSSSISTTHRTL